MSARLVALDEGSDIPVDRAMVVVGRHPQCDARLDSIRISRRHCCMTQDHGDLIVRDLGSTNGIRINGQRVEMGRLHPGDELSIAHIRFRLDSGNSQELTQACPDSSSERADGHFYPFRAAGPAAGLNAAPAVMSPSPAHLVVKSDSPLAAAVRELLPSSIPERCRIQLIFQNDPDSNGSG